jgi:hypothetical protein
MAQEQLVDSAMLVDLAMLVGTDLNQGVKELGGCFLNQVCRETAGLPTANFKSKKHTIFYVKKEVFPENMFEQRLRG